MSGRRRSHRDVRGYTRPLNVRDWASLSPENLSSPRAGGGWQFSVLRSDLSVPRLLTTPAHGASAPHLRTNFLQFSGAQELLCQATPCPQRGPFSLRLALHPGTGRLCSPHLAGPALGGLTPVGTVPAICPYFIRRRSRPSEGHESAARPLPETFGRTHRDEPPEPQLPAAMLRPLQRGHGAWSPQPPATASLHGAAGARPS